MAIFRAWTWIQLFFSAFSATFARSAFSYSLAMAWVVPVLKGRLTAGTEPVGIGASGTSARRLGSVTSSTPKGPRRRAAGGRVGASGVVRWTGNGGAVAGGGEGARALALGNRSETGGLGECLGRRRRRCGAGGAGPDGGVAPGRGAVGARLEGALGRIVQHRGADGGRRTAAEGSLGLLEPDLHLLVGRGERNGLAKQREGRAVEALAHQDLGDEVVGERILPVHGDGLVELLHRLGGASQADQRLSPEDVPVDAVRMVDEPLLAHLGRAGILTLLDEHPSQLHEEGGGWIGGEKLLVPLHQGFGHRSLR